MIKKCISIILIVSFALSNIVVVHGAKSTAKVTEIEGTVKIKRAGSSKEFKAFKNMTINEGDKVRVGSDGSVTLVVNEKNIIKANKSSSFTIVSLNKIKKEPSSAYTIHYGTVTNDVNKKGFAIDSYKVKTSNTVMGVRGTVFEVAKKISDSGNEEISLITLDGIVAVSDRRLSEDGTSNLSDVGLVTANQQIIFSNDDENSGEIVVLDISKQSVETLLWIQENEEYLSETQKVAVDEALIIAQNVEDKEEEDKDKENVKYMHDGCYWRRERGAPLHSLCVGAALTSPAPPT